jgi:citronellol/citronellal dehydrogenase
VELDGKVAIVTGASRGIGAATSIALAASGARVVCAARSTRSSPRRTPGTLDDTVATIRETGGTAIAVPTDLTDVDGTRSLASRAIEEFGGIDVLINNAGLTFVGGIDMDLKRHQVVMDVNLTAPLVLIGSAAPSMKSRGGGAIVNVSSAAALNVFPSMMSYGISKAALERLTVDAAEQLRADGIAVNCFRIDMSIASEGFMSNMPDGSYDDWEPCEVPVEGMMWILDQPPTFTGQLLSLQEMRHEFGIMSTRAKVMPKPLEGQVWNWRVGTPKVDW